MPILALNVVYPLVPEEIVAFCAGKRAVLVLEEGQPEFIEQDIATTCGATMRSRSSTAKTCCRWRVTTPPNSWCGDCPHSSRCTRPSSISAAGAMAGEQSRHAQAASELRPLPSRPPNFCIGCPERPVFAALKLAEQDTGRPHISGDIGCHAFATFEPFSMGNSILGYGMSLATAAGVGPMMAKRPLAVMGDGGFWHNGLLSGVASNLLNKGDAVLVIMKNGYASATGTQELISSPRPSARDASGKSMAHADRTIENTLAGLGVTWVKTVHTYDVAEMTKTYRRAHHRRRRVSR